jgi:homoserine/homoserine lactone efflux protein
MSFEAWLAFCVTETILCVTPGPAVLLVLSVALGRGFRSAIGASLGILTANALYFTLSATGVAAVLVASREVFLALQWVGAGYLMWLGLCMMLARDRREADALPVLVAQSFVRGVVVQGANPKALVFFLALLPQFIDSSASVLPQVLILGVSSVVIELAVLALYARAAVHARRVAGGRLTTPLKRVGGALLLAAGARLVVARAE